MLKKTIKALVAARLAVLPRDVKISIGGDGHYSKKELIAHVHKGDRVGQKIAQIHLSYLRSLKEGIFYH